MPCGRADGNSGLKDTMCFQHPHANFSSRISTSECCSSFSWHCRDTARVGHLRDTSGSGNSRDHSNYDPSSISIYMVAINPV